MVAASAYIQNEENKTKHVNSVFTQ